MYRRKVQEGFVEMIDREMAGIDREMARIDREMAGIDREMAGIDRKWRGNKNGSRRCYSCFTLLLLVPTRDFEA
jgi:hypothetical protein